jgi:hypothetical protein
MPPRKSDISKVATGDDETPARDLPRDAVNLEVHDSPHCVKTDWMNRMANYKG